MGTLQLSMVQEGREQAVDHPGGLPKTSWKVVFQAVKKSLRLVPEHQVAVLGSRGVRSRALVSEYVGAPVGVVRADQDVWDSICDPSDQTPSLGHLESVEQ